MTGKPQSAFETVDDLYNHQVDLYKVTDKGIVTQPAVIDVEGRDISLHWQQHRRALWFIVAICGFYFLTVLW